MRPAWLVLAWSLLLVIAPIPRAWPHADLELQIEELTLQLERQPDNVEWLLKRGDLQRRHQSYQLARNDFRRVRSIQPDNETVDWFAGRLEVESGQPETGIVYLDQFLQVNPDHGIALQNRAQAHLLLHQPLLAAEDYQRVILISDKPAPSLYSDGARALVAAGSEYFQPAMDLIKQGLMRFPGEVTLTGLGTDIALARSDVETAQELMDTLPAAILRLPQWQARVALLDSRLSE